MGKSLPTQNWTMSITPDLSTEAGRREWFKGIGDRDDPIDVEES